MLPLVGGRLRSDLSQGPSAAWPDRRSGALTERFIHAAPEHHDHGEADAPAEFRTCSRVNRQDD